MVFYKHLAAIATMNSCDLGHYSEHYSHHRKQLHYGLRIAAIGYSDVPL
jgi:hypothetical protein